MKTKITHLSKLKVSLLFIASLFFVQLSAQQTIEAETYSESLYVGINESENFSGGKAITMRAASGSFVKYQVTVATEGTYDITISYATMNLRRMYIKVEEYMPVIAEFTTFTGGWFGEPGTDEEGNPLNGIETLTLQVYMNAGENTIEIGAYDAPEQSDSPNFDKFTIAPSTQTIAKPADQPALMVLEAENATKSVGANIEDKDCYSGGKGAFSMNSANDASLIFENVNITEEGIYDITVYYTTMSLRSLYVKSNNYEKSVLRCNIEFPYWSCPEKPEDYSDTRPIIAKKTTQAYMDAGKNTIIVGAYQGWGPNVDKIEIVKSAYVMEKPEYESNASVFDFTDNLVDFKTDFIEEHATDSTNRMNLIDNNEFTYYTVNGASSAMITIKTAYPIILTGYAIACSDKAEASLMDNWEVEYSTDNTTWTEVAASLATDAGSFRKVVTAYAPTDETIISAQYFRLTATGSGKIEVGEFQLYGVPYVDEYENFPQDDLTRDIPFENILDNAVAEPEGLYDFDELYQYVFDKSLRTVYTVDGTSFVIQFQPNDPVMMKSYALTTRYIEIARNPSKWKLEGVDAATADWIVLDSREDMKFPVPGSTMMFNIENPVLCYQYILTVEANSGGNMTHLTQWQMFEDCFGPGECPGSTNPEPGEGVEQVAGETAYTLVAQAGAFSIYSNAGAQQEYKVYNVSGQLVKEGYCVPGENKVTIQNGLYIVQIGSYTGKVIVK